MTRDDLRALADFAKDAGALADLVRIALDRCGETIDGEKANELSRAFSRRRWGFLKSTPSEDGNSNALRKGFP